MNIDKKSYKRLCSNENNPNAIPSFQIKLIFKNFEENKSVDKIFSLYEITKILENLSKKKIIRTIKIFIIKFFFKFFIIIEDVSHMAQH